MNKMAENRKPYRITAVKDEALVETPILYLTKREVEIFDECMYEIWKLLDNYAPDRDVNVWFEEV